MIPGSKGQKAIRACTIKLLILGPAKHENQVSVKRPFDTNFIKISSSNNYTTPDASFP